MGEAGSSAALAQGVGGLSSAAGGYAQSRAYLSQGKYVGAISDVNAKLADLQAADAIRRGKNEAALVGERGLQVQQQQRTQLAAGGVDVNSGNAAAIQEGTGAMSYLDQLRVTNNAALEAIGYKMEAINLTGQGRMARISGRANSNASLISGGMGFAKDALMGAAIYSKYKIHVPVQPRSGLPKENLEPEWYPLPPGGGTTEAMPGKSAFTSSDLD